MNNVTEIEILGMNSEPEMHVLITAADGSFTCMPKAVWDELEAKREQSGTLS